MTSPTQTLITAARRSQEWLRDRPLVFDIAFAGFAAIMALGELTGEASDGTRQPDSVAVLLILLGGFLLLWRRTAPVAALFLVAAVSSAFYTLDYGSFMAFIGTAALYSVAAHEQNRRIAWMAIGIVSAGLITLAGFTVLDGPDGFSIPDATGMVISIGAVVVAGAVIRNKDEIFADTKERAERAEADRKMEAERAVNRERLRIAREMHDVVAHGMSLMTVQAAAAREIAKIRPDDAANLMRSVETTGRDSLAEMRRMLGVLRNDEAGDAPADRGERFPQPSLADLGTVVAHCVEAGIPTELSISGEERSLPPGIELAAFRIVQEALTNVVKHGGDAATAAVVLRYDTDTLHIEIRDTGRGAVSSLGPNGGGHGLIGMRERVEIYDGELSAGPQSGGGYAVIASLPLSARSSRSAAVSTDSDSEAVT